VPAAAIDFTPAIAEETARREKSAFDKWLLRHRPVQHGRWLIHSTPDTGWRLTRDFAGEASEAMQPVVDVAGEISLPKQLTKGWGGWLELRLPSRWSFLPAPGTYLNPTDAPAFQHPGIHFLQPEKFVWRGAPFAFHLRGQIREIIDRRVHGEEDWSTLQTILDRVAANCSWHEWDA
jgi:hypothetical protein